MKSRSLWLLCLCLCTSLLFAADSPVKKQNNSKKSKAIAKAPSKASEKTKDNSETQQVAETEKEKLPPILARNERSEERRRAIPGNYGLGSASSPQEQAYLNRAYPDKEISISQIERSRSAYQGKRGNFGHGKGRKGDWVSVGPSSAEYQSTPLRNVYSYVPAKYLAGGRTPALAISPNCTNGHCRLWIGAAGGGIWRTNDALQGQAHWDFLSTPFEMNSVSSIVVDPGDSDGDTIYVGTGESNSSADSAAGVGIYKSYDGGDHWIGPLGSDVFKGRAVGTIAVNPKNSRVIYAGSTRAVLGVSATTAGAVSLIPGAAMFGLYKSTDGGNHWTLIHEGSADVTQCTSVTFNIVNNATACSPRGTRRVALDPSDPNIVYASSMGRGVWRSNDAGATWSQVKAPLTTSGTMRSEFAVNKLSNGKTRMYIGEGDSGSPYSRLFRADDVSSGVPVFSSLTSSNVADPGYGSYNYCEGQCWYDNYVVSPAGYPDVVYLLGSYAYGEQLSNKRGVVLSTDAGVSFTDMTMDATSFYFPNGIHPDQHSLVVNPRNPYQFFEGSDGGVMRSERSVCQCLG